MENKYPEKVECWLPEELKFKFKFLAMKKKKSMNVIVRELIQEYIKKENQGE